MLNKQHSKFECFAEKLVLESDSGGDVVSVNFWIVFV